MKCLIFKRNKHQAKRWCCSFQVVGKKTKQSAGVTTVFFFEKVQANTLYGLQNLNRGVEERLFTYENGKQILF